MLDYKKRKKKRKLAANAGKNIKLDLTYRKSFNSIEIKPTFHYMKLFAFIAKLIRQYGWEREKNGQTETEKIKKTVSLSLYTHTLVKTSCIILTISYNFPCQVTHFRRISSWHFIEIYFGRNTIPAPFCWRTVLCDWTVITFPFLKFHSHTSGCEASNKGYVKSVLLCSNARGASQYVSKSEGKRQKVKTIKL